MNASFRGYLRPAVLALLLVVFASLARGQTTPPAWTQKARHADIVYFAFPTPARLERYDLAQEKWLSSISLATAATALHVDAGGIFLAHGRAVARRALDGTGEQALYNATTDINGLLADGSFIFVFSPAGSESRITSLRKSDGQLVASWQTYYSMGVGYSIAPVSRRLYGINNYTTAFSTIELGYSATGTFGTAKEVSSDSGSFSEQSRTYVFPNESALIRNNGRVFSTPGLGNRANLGGAFDDLAFHGDDVPIVLRGNRLHAYANTLLEAGQHTLAAAAQAIAVRAGQVYAFSRDSSAPSGIAVAKVAVASITPAQPGAPIDPAGLPLVPDDVIAAGDGTFFLFSRQYQSIFRWSSAQRRYTASIPLPSAPTKVAYSATLNRLYLGYETGAINQIKLDAGSTAVEPFATLPLAVRGLQTAGDLVFAADASGAWDTHYVYDRHGVLTDSREWSEYSAAYVWSPVQRRMYYFRDDTSPNDLNAVPISAAGKLGTKTETPYHGTYSFAHPIRISSDETGILVGSGVIFAASDLTVAGSLANSVVDADSRDGRWFSVRASGTDSQVQTWTTTFLFDRGFTVPGSPLRIFSLGANSLLVLTKGAERVAYSLVDLTGAGSVTTSPLITAEPAAATAYLGRTVTLSVAAQGTGLAYQWKHNGTAVPGATGASLTLANLASTHAGAYTVTISNLLGELISKVATLTVQDPPPPPVIQTQPSDQVVPPGNTIYLSVTATGTGPLLYQWRKAGTAITGATGATYSKSGMSAADVGDYTVVVTNDGGSTESRAAAVSLPVRVEAFNARFVLDARGAVAHFTVENGGTRPLLIRVLGPALQPLGVPTPAADPRLAVVTPSGLTVAANDDWSTAANNAELAALAQQVGAAPLAAGSKDAALTVTLAAGTYQVLVGAAAGSGTGLALLEIHDLGSAQYPRLGYFAVRAPVGPGADALTGGILLSGPGAKPFLLRALGPALGLPGALSDPALTWARATSILASNDQWSAADPADLVVAAARFGLLPLSPGSPDAALFTPTQVLAGAYTAQLLGDRGRPGWGLLEIVDTDPTRPTNHAPILLVPPQSQVAAPGSDLLLQVKSGGTAPLSYVWHKNGAQLVGANDAAILLRGVTAADAGSYTVTISNGSGVVSSAPAVVTVSAAPPGQASFAVSHAAPLYAPGATITVTCTLTFSAAPASLGWAATIPAGWTYAGGTDEPGVKPFVGAGGTLEWAWTEVPASPVRFSFHLAVPAAETENRTITARALLRVDGAEQAATPEPLVLASALRFHTADLNRDGRIALFELLRIIELYNTRSGNLRTGQYRESPGTEDGYAPDPSAAPAAITRHHVADTSRDGRLSLSELTRVIGLYNTRAGTVRTGAYRPDTLGEDGFAPAP